MRVAIAIVAVLAALLAAVLLPSARPAPVLLLAVDGMEWDILLPLLRAGRLPHLQGVISRGTAGLLETEIPTLSPILWTTIATGKAASRHGVPGFKLEDRLVDSRDRLTKAFWEIAGDQGRSVTVVGWWLTYPVEPVQGVMVAQVNTLEQWRKQGLVLKGALYEGMTGQVHPPELEPELLEIVAASEHDLPKVIEEVAGVSIESAPPELERVLRASRWAFRADLIYERVALHLLETQPPPDVFAVYLSTPDVVGHRFLPKGSKWSHAVTRTYERVDAALGRLLGLWPADGVVMVVSDHGMHVDVHPEVGKHGDGPPGVLIAAGPRIRARPLPAFERSALPVLGSIRDVTPTLLTLLDVPLGRDMDGYVLTDVIEDPERRPPPVASHDTETWRAHRVAPSLPTSNDPERLEQLRALGYIE